MNFIWAIINLNTVEMFTLFHKTCLCRFRYQARQYLQGLYTWPSLPHRFHSVFPLISLFGLFIGQFLIYVLIVLILPIFLITKFSPSLPCSPFPLTYSNIASLHVLANTRLLHLKFSVFLMKVRNQYQTWLAVWILWCLLSNYWSLSDISFFFVDIPTEIERVGSGESG